MSVWDYIKRNADRPDNWSSEGLSGADFRELLATRNAIIEECAKVVMPFDPSGEMAKAVRALKDKP